MHGDASGHIENRSISLLHNAILLRAISLGELTMNLVFAKVLQEFMRSELDPCWSESGKFGTLKYV